MLPFIKKNKEASVAGIIMKTRSPDEKPEADKDEASDPSAAINACADELIRAVHARDTKAVSAALKDAFDILESMDDEDEASESASPHTYEAQNIKAAQES